MPDKDSYKCYVISLARVAKEGLRVFWREIVGQVLHFEVFQAVDGSALTFR